MYWITECKICKAGSQFTLKTYAVNPVAYADLRHLQGYGTLTIHLRFCLWCGFIYHDHVLSLDELQRLYEQEDRITHKKETLQKQVLLERASSFLKRNYDFSLMSKVIDIGSGDFSLLDELSDHAPAVNFDAVNVSFPTDQRGKMRVFRLMLEEMEESHSYDLIILSHILEHIADFDSFFGHLQKLTHAATMLYVEVPFQVGPTLLLDRGFHAQHINYFTPLTLRLLLEEKGYQLDCWEFDTEGGYLYYGLPGVIRAKFSPRKEKLTMPNRVPYSSLFTLVYLLSPHIFIRGTVKRFLRRGQQKDMENNDEKLILSRGDIGWIAGFVSSYFIFSTVLYFIFFHQESYLSAMLVTGSVFVLGECVRRWLK